jgi:acyl-CoA synthetase (AMP-forming)/AMP-acid ligase II
LPVTTSFDEPYRLVSTGGTTGKSKGVLHSHVGTYFTVLADIAEYGIGRGWHTLSILPTYHVAGMEWGLFTILWRTGTVVFPADTSFNPQRYLAEIRKRDIEYLALVPAVIAPLFDAWDGVPLRGPRTVITTAAPTSPPLRRKLVEMFPDANVLAAAGLSESLNLATQSPGEILSHPDSIGEPHIDTRLLILDDDDRVVARNTPGHIAMRNFNTALGYHHDDAAAAVTWRARQGDAEGLHWCFTGDIGVMDEDGRVTLVDRSKDVIKTGGESVPSVEVETVYSEHPGIRDCAAVGVEDERWGEAILLVAVKNDPAANDRDLAADIFQYGRDRLAGFKRPKKIAFTESLPRSHFGKVLKRDLREQPFREIFES